MRILLPLALAASLAAPVLAEDQAETDKGWLVGFLEDNLSDAGRQISIEGFEGALSSRATIRKLTIADDDGIWIELDDITLDWNRRALLRGEIRVNELSAGQISLLRLPERPEKPVTPEAEPFTFSLPELPVAIEIREIRADHIDLGEEVLGQEFQGTLRAEMQLAGGDGQASLQLQRVGPGPEGLIKLDASYSNTSTELNIALDVREGEGGIIASRLNLPGLPATSLTLNGSGRLDDFHAEFRLATDDEDRLAGPITLSGDSAGAWVFTAGLRGNPAPLFLPDHAGFLGDDLLFDLSGRRLADGRLHLDELSLQARSLSLNGAVDLAADGFPERIDIQGHIGLPGDEPVLLPIGGRNKTYLRRADVALIFDSSKGTGWNLDLVMAGLERPSRFVIDQASLRGAGRIGRFDGLRSVDGTIGFDMSGIGGLDPALQAALGPALSGQAEFSWHEDGGFLNLPQIVLTGEDYGIEDAALQIRGLREALWMSGHASIRADDLSRFGKLAGRPLGGSARIGLSGGTSVLTGGFDLDIGLTANGLRVGNDAADQLLRGESTATARLRRDETGLSLDRFQISAASLNLMAEGQLSSQGHNLTGQLNWGNLSDMGPRYGGNLTAGFTFAGTPESATITLDGAGRDLRTGQAMLDPVIAGRADISARARLESGILRMDQASIETPNLTFSVRQQNGSGRLDVNGRLRDLALIVPEFPGPLTISGQVTPQGNAYQANLRLQGPGAINAQITGRMAARGPDLRIVGTSNAAIANGFIQPVMVSGGLAFDVRLTGWRLADVGGRVTLSNGRLSLPVNGIGLERIAATADLAGGSARLAVTADALQGGRLGVNGNIGLVAPFNADLNIRLDRVRLRNPDLYDTIIDGGLRLSGPLAGRANLAGTLNLSETELRIPSSGFANASDLEAVRHVRDSSAVRATRDRAGLGEKRAETAPDGPAWGIDIRIQAPHSIFIRGRGLDAELGGTIHLGGTIRDLIPSGGFELIRGRLSLLGRRLDLTRATLTLVGNFVPFLDIAAVNVRDGMTITIAIEGPANDPEVTFSSSPAMPEEEILAQLIFGRGISSMSAFQALQLANTVAVLSGRGGVQVVDRLRKTFGLADLNVTTAESGAVTVTAGRYITDNLYSEIGVDNTGNARINLNLDVSNNVTLKGRVDSNGNSGIGIFLEKDY